MNYWCLRDTHLIHVAATQWCPGTEGWTLPPRAVNTALGNRWAVPLARNSFFSWMGNCLSSLTSQCPHSAPWHGGGPSSTSQQMSLFLPEWQLLLSMAPASGWCPRPIRNGVCKEGKGVTFKAPSFGISEVCHFQLPHLKAPGDKWSPPAHVTSGLQ